MANAYNLKKYNNNYFRQIINDCCVYILNNRNKTYDEIFDYLKNYYEISEKKLLIIIEKYDLFSEDLIKATLLVIKHMKNKKNNINDDILNRKFNSLGQVKLVEQKKQEINYLPHFCSKYSFPKDEENSKKIEEITKLLINGEKLDDVAKKFNSSIKTIESLMRKYLPKNPELFVKYKISEKSIQPIDEEELKQYKEVVYYFINNLERTILNKQINPDLTIEYKKELTYLKQILKQYVQCLNCLNFQNTIMKSVTKNVDDFIIDYCLNISEIIKLKKRLKSNNVSEETQKQIYIEYKKKLNLK